MKRIGLYLMTNIAILMVLSISLSLLGFEGYLDSQGVDLDIKGLVMFAAAFGISGGLGHGIKRLFMTHPPLEERIAMLRSAQ